MKTYLKITNQPDGKIDVTAADGVFSYAITCKDRNAFVNYCDIRKDAWLNSDLGNFDGWDKSKREEIAHKWELAKQLSEGDYNYFFSLEDIKTIFQNEVDNLAKSFGIKNYILKIYE